METALRALETIVPSANAGRKLDKEGADSLGPEWLADLYRASAECGGISWDDFLWRLPLAAAAHLLAATHRHNGGTTSRPVDWMAALDAIAENEAGPNTSIDKAENDGCEEKYTDEQMNKDNHGVQ
ncbi:MAG: hypothetical protein ACI4SG_08690 [Oligosphaeraceae bacterium]